MTPTETKVCEICCRVLALEVVEPNDDLYELGSDSHQAVLIALEVERAFRVELSLEVMEVSSKVSTLAAWLDRQIQSPRLLTLSDGHRSPMS